MMIPRDAARLVLIRHGEAKGNRELVYLGSTDASLTPHGEEQALEVARSPLVAGCAAIYTSPLVRARDTARAIADALHVEPVVWDDLREMDFGSWELLTRLEAGERDAALLAAWESGADVAPPGGEKLAAVFSRSVGVADLLAERHPGQAIALVSHVGPVKELVCAALELPPAAAQRMWLDPASICIVDWWPHASSRRGILRVFNLTAHLAEPPRWQRG